MMDRERPRGHRLLLVGVFAVATCVPDAGLAVHDAPALILTSANLVMVEDGRVLPDHYLWLEGGRIVAFGPGTPTDAPRDARRMDLGGDWILPGLIDMHVHVGAEQMPLLLQSGITTVRQMWGSAAALELRAKAENGALLPAMIVASPGIDGPGGPIPGAEVVRDADEVRALVPKLQATDWDLIKVYQFLSLPAYRELVRQARINGWTLAGHVPTTVDLAEAMRDMRTIEHLEGYDRALVGVRRRGFAAWADADTARMADLATRTAAAGVWNVPTLIVAERVAAQNLDPETAARVRDRRLAMVRRLHAAGAGILVGTDAGVPVSPPGESYHDEIEALLGAGMTPAEVLRAATSDAARALDLGDEIGAIRVGARGDLLVVEANPLLHPGTLRHPRMVILRGHVVPEAGL